MYNDHSYGNEKQDLHFPMSRHCRHIVTCHYLIPTSSFGLRTITFSIQCIIALDTDATVSRCRKSIEHNRRNVPLSKRPIVETRNGY